MDPNIRENSMAKGIIKSVNTSNKTNIVLTVDVYDDEDTYKGQIVRGLSRSTTDTAEAKKFVEDAVKSFVAQIIDEDKSVLASEAVKLVDVEIPTVAAVPK